MRLAADTSRDKRLFKRGELRLLVLTMIADQPRSGYELIRAIEECMGGSYSPSTSVVYSMMHWLKDMGFAVVETDLTGRKRCRLTAEGHAFLNANQAAAAALYSRFGSDRIGPHDSSKLPITRAVRDLQLALRLRLKNGPLDQATAERIAAILDAAAQAVQRT
jgi:DNA-binding PadR family transcriptional regulator